MLTVYVSRSPASKGLLSRLGSERMGGRGRESEILPNLGLLLLSLSRVSQSQLLRERFVVPAPLTRVCDALSCFRLLEFIDRRLLVKENPNSYAL